MAKEREVLFASLRRNLDAGDVERAAREFTDGLGGPGTWDRRTPEQKQVTLDNMATAIGPQDNPDLRPDEIARLPFPIHLIVGERSPKRFKETAQLQSAYGRLVAP
jgi:hypothetical protein